jgi:hypothetical protein
MRNPQATVLVLSLLSWTAPVRADTTDTNQLVTGIGTHIDDPFGDNWGPGIDTRVDSVTYGDPVHFMRDGLSYTEWRGTLSGQGWGGFAATPFGYLVVTGVYDYVDVPFVLRVPDRWSGDLVVYHNGGSKIEDQLFFEAYCYPGNPWWNCPYNDFRRKEEEGDRVASDAVLMPRVGAAYFAIGKYGLRHDGTPAASYQDGAHIFGVPIAKGSHLCMSFDVPITRDTTLVGKRLVERLGGRVVRRTYGIGHSAGSFTLAAMNLGRGVLPIRCAGPDCTFYNAGTGDNHLDPYQPSGLLYDGFVLMGYGNFKIPVPSFDPREPALGTPAPMIILRGQADDFYGEEMALADELLGDGVPDLARWFRIYHIANLTHGSADMMETSPNLNSGVGWSTEGERLRPLIVASIMNLRAALDDGTPLPPSVIDTPPDFTPLATDPDLDVLDRLTRLYTCVPDATHACPFPYPVDQPLRDAWARVMAGLPHETGRIELLRTACRLGGLDLPFLGSALLPFSSAELRERWGSYGQFLGCEMRTMAHLAGRRLYDMKAGLDIVAADETARAAFATSGRPGVLLGSQSER